jgi:hypothetical protein
VLGQAYQPTGEEAYKETPEQRVSDGAGQGGGGRGGQCVCNAALLGPGTSACCMGA